MKTFWTFGSIGVSSRPVTGIHNIVTPLSLHRGVLRGVSVSASAKKVVNRRWEEVFGWPLFRPLVADDKHVFQSIRVPLSENQHEFDQQVLSLAKVLVDSLNEVKLQAGMPPAGERESGLGKLATFVNTLGWEAGEGHLDFLRKLQGLRSTGSAHHKGKELRKGRRKFSVAVTRICSYRSSVIPHGD